VEALDLLVCIDPWMTATARYADYVIAPTLPLETPAATSLQDMLSLRATGYGVAESYAQYTPAVVDPPLGSDVIEDWRFFHDLIVAMGHPVFVRPPAAGRKVPARRLDTRPSTVELMEVLAEGSRIPFDVVRDHAGGALYPEPAVVVGPPDEEDTGRLDVGSAEMLTLLAERDRRAPEPGSAAFQLLCRRNNHTYNSSCNVPATNRGVRHNPAFMHPEDISALGLDVGDLVRIRTSHDSILAMVASDPDLRRETVSMAFGYGPSNEAADIPITGSSPNRIIPNDGMFDRYTGQPRMSALWVEVIPASGEERVDASANAAP